VAPALGLGLVGEVSPAPEPLCLVLEGTEEGEDAAQGDAGGGDFIVEGQVIGAGDEVGKLLGQEGGGVESMGAAVLVALRGSGAGVAAGVGGAAWQ
jgi:hypothetical protein